MALSSAGFPRITRHVITTLSPESLGVELLQWRLEVPPGSSAAQGANDAFYIPFSVSQPVTALQMIHYNGSVASGNLDLGLYTNTGTLLVSSGPTAQTGTSTLQLFNITDTLLVPGRYYMAVGYSSDIATTFAYTPAAAVIRMLGVLFENVGTLPATATFAQTALAFIPIIGVAFETVL